MRQFERKIIIFDFIAINFAWICYYLLRVEGQIVLYQAKPDLLMPMEIRAFKVLVEVEKK